MTAGVGHGNGNGDRWVYSVGMCGRYTLTVSGRVLAELFELDEVHEIAPRYNIAPSQQVPIVRLGANGGRLLEPARWGLVPSWAKEVDAGARLINARAETLADKPSFRNALKRRRCLLPADGFYEWRATGAGKQPYLIRFGDGRPFAFAGLFEHWRSPEGDTLLSCTIVTTAPNPVVAALHDRMPVILPRQRHEQWLSAAELDRVQLAELLVPHPAADMEAFPVSRRVNNPNVDDPACVARVEA
jgi:putative SOS response-associated peptidase YedK